MCETKMTQTELINSVVSETTMANYNAARAIRNGGGMGILSNPFEIPQQLVLKGTAPAESTKTNFFMDDSLGLASALGLVGADTGIVLTGVNGITVTILQKFLQTHAIVFGGYNFESTESSLLSNNLKVIYSSLDTNTKSKNLFSAQSVSNMQNNPNLLNVDQPFILTNSSAMKIGVTANGADGAAVVYTFTFKIIGAVPYGKLDEFLAAAQIPERSKLSC